MFKALLKTYTTDTSVASHELPFDLAGSWLPARHDEWYNRLPGKHSQRARSKSTKMTYDSNGQGSGWVGEVFVNVQARCIAPGRYNAQFQVRTSAKTLPWRANDGHLTLLEDGILQVQYPSHGIIEYWRKADGRGIEILQAARKEFRGGRSRGNSSSRNTTDTVNARSALPNKPCRSIKLVFRHFGDSMGAKKDGSMWHWGLSIDDSIYEVNGAMAVMGPDGIVAASSPMAKPIRTEISQFHGYVDLSQTTWKSDQEIEEFTCRWVKQHPVYKALGPNCQTYAEDLFMFLTGEDLPFAKSADRLVGSTIRSCRGMDGPEVDPSAVWLRPEKKPNRTSR